LTFSGCKIPDTYGECLTGSLLVILYVAVIPFRCLRSYNQLKNSWPVKEQEEYSLIRKKKLTSATLA